MSVDATVFIVSTPERDEICIKTVGQRYEEIVSRFGKENVSIAACVRCCDERSAAHYLETLRMQGDEKRLVVTEYDLHVGCLCKLRKMFADYAFFPYTDTTQGCHLYVHCKNTNDAPSIQERRIFETVTRFCGGDFEQGFHVIYPTSILLWKADFPSTKDAISAAQILRTSVDGAPFHVTMDLQRLVHRSLVISSMMMSHEERTNNYSTCFSMGAEHDEVDEAIRRQIMFILTVQK